MDAKEFRMQYQLSQVSREILITKQRNTTEDSFDAEAWFSARQTELSLRKQVFIYLFLSQLQPDSQSNSKEKVLLKQNI